MEAIAVRIKGIHNERVFLAERRHESRARGSGHSRYAEVLVADKPITTKLLFRKPLDTAELVNLDIPGTAAGVNDPFRLTLPLKGNCGKN